MIPERFKLVREIRGFTQIELVRRIESLNGRHVAQSTVAEIETGRLVPSSDLAEAIGQATGFPLEFFELGDLREFPSGSLVFFRAKSVVTAKEEAQVRRHAQLAAEIVDVLSRRIDLLQCRIPQLTECAPTEAAQLTRSALGLSPDSPIDNLIRTIERAGVLLLALPISRDPVDAFSVWTGQRDQVPCIALLSDAPADRQRFSVAHELGHLVLHRSMRGSTALLEDEASRFASELLTPRAAMELEIVRPVTLFGLRDLKARWRVSMRMLINRAHEVGGITARQRSYLFMKMNATFGGRAEPTLFLKERPRALHQMFEMVYGIPIDYETAAFDLHLAPQMIETMLQQYQGGASRTNDAPENVFDFHPGT